MYQNQNINFVILLQMWRMALLLRNIGHLATASPMKRKHQEWSNIHKQIKQRITQNSFEAHILKKIRNYIFFRWSKKYVSLTLKHWLIFCCSIFFQQLERWINVNYGLYRRPRCHDRPAIFYFSPTDSFIFC